MIRFLAKWTAIVACGMALLPQATGAAEPPKSTTASPAGGLDPNDPLFKALEQVQREVNDLRREARGGKPSPAPQGMPSAMPSSAVPARGSSVRQQPLVTSSAEPRGIAVPAPTRSAATAKILPPAKSAKVTLWSFQPLKAPAVPPVQASAWPRDDVDRFLLAKLQAAQVAPNPEASAAALCRRAYFDLIGLPPTEQELLEFIAAASKSAAAKDKAYAELVDKLLASPRFGERWGRHWLDVVRYADSVGRSWNAPFTYAWRYRDYVIDAFNQDTPLDTFITEQLAGDLLTAADPLVRRRQLQATGFLSLGALELRPGSEEIFRLDQIDDQIDVTTRGFLGLTISCARCHDHKYDPVTMRDYYALAGIFYSTYTLSGQGHQGDSGPGGYVDVDKLLRLPSAPPSAKAASTAAIDLTGTDGLDIHTMSDYQDIWSRGKRNIRYATDRNVAMGAIEGTIEDCPIREKGEPYDRGEAPPRGNVRIPALPRLPAIPPTASGRLQLARWIAARENPLTARVYVNRIWRHLFGRGLVRTVDDFGMTGEAPTHPELLEHLAVRFIDDGWSTKQLIRTLMLSRAYRTSAAGDTPGAAKDPANELFGRASLRRLEWEPLRDTLLAAAGRLTFERPEIVPVTGIGGKAGQSAARSIFGIEAPYRTIYLPVIRGGLPEIYGTFDFPDPTQIKGDREVTTVAPQALFLLNDELIADCARDAAARLLENGGLNDAGRVRLAYLRLLSREPMPDETSAALQLLASLDPNAEAHDPQHYRWATLVQALLASAEFRYVQ